MLISVASVIRRFLDQPAAANSSAGTPVRINPRAYSSSVPAPVLHHAQLRVILQNTNVRDRIAVHDQQIGERSLRQRSNTAARIERKAAVARRADQRFGARHAEQADEVLEVFR